MITRLMVRDWGPFDQKTVEFKPGKNVLYGKNFSGKTSLVNAMFYALTGEVLAPKAKPADFVRASSRDSIVELDLTLGPEAFRVRRRPTRKQSHILRLEEGSEVSEVASGSSVDSKVAELLEARVPELTQAIFMKEGEIPEYLASSTPMKRKEFVKSLIKLDRLEEITDAAKEWQSEVNARAKELERAFAQTNTNITMLKAKPRPPADPRGRGSRQDGKRDRDVKIDQPLPVLFLPNRSLGRVESFTPKSHICVASAQLCR